MYAQAPTPVRSVRPYYELKVRDEKVADMELDMVADMVADIVADKKMADMVADKKNLTDKKTTTKTKTKNTIREHHKRGIFEDI